MLTFRKGNQDDLGALVALYGAVCGHQQTLEPSPTGWRWNIYPTPAVAQEGLTAETLYVLEDSAGLAGTMILNQDQPQAYGGVRWNVDASPDRVLVVHTFMVHQDRAGKGYGRVMLNHALGVARSQGCTALRLDTSELNLPAQALYRKAGYALCGVVDLGLNIPGRRWFHCYELPVRA